MAKKENARSKATPDAKEFTPGEKTRIGKKLAERALLPRPDKQRKNKNP